MTEYGLCRCGCGEKTFIPDRNRYGRGQLKGVPMLFVSHHNFKIHKSDYTVDSNGCWISNRARTTKGYTQGPLFKGKRKKLHVWFYENKYGPVPTGLILDHKCRVRACVNPDHLEPVTTGENSRRGLNTKIDWAKVQEIRESYGKISNDELALKYGISAGHVSRIALRKAWINP